MSWPLNGSLRGDRFMLPVPHDEPTSTSSLNVLQPLRRRAALAWLGWLLSIGLLLAQHYLRVLHPLALVFILLLLVTFAGVVGGLLRGLWRILRGPQRRPWKRTSGTTCSGPSRTGPATALGEAAASSIRRRVSPSCAGTPLKNSPRSLGPSSAGTATSATSSVGKTQGSLQERGGRN